MSVLFGVWNFDRKPVNQAVMCAADATLTCYAPDASNRHNSTGFSVTYHGLHTNFESRREKQPYVSASGAVVVFDGRLDNRLELIRDFGRVLTTDSTDVEIVAAAFDHRGADCFSKLIGDWAVSVWNEREQTLVLAKDFLGSRPLYYIKEENGVQWSSTLEPLVTLSKRQFALNCEYAAGWLSMYPAADITPFVGICAVPPSSFVSLNRNKCTVVKYWDFNPEKRIVLRTDADYEQCFRSAFREAVQRRLRSDQPICAELSGGMDSTSITCVADLIASSATEIPVIHTLSMYDDTEPHLDERRYFKKVEEKRGRCGFHIDLANQDMFAFEDASRFVALPACMPGPEDLSAKRRLFLESNNIRVVLSGIGGDETMGGIPTPIPEIQDALVQGQFLDLTHLLKVWALAKRKPWFYLLGDALREFLPTHFLPIPQYLRPMPWIQRTFAEQNMSAFSGYSQRTRFRQAPPSFQSNLSALEVVRRQLAANGLSSERVDKRYPFLDRSLLEFIFAIPREQLVRPGYRRSLMRRALRGIVPAEILERRRKGYVSRAPRAAITREWQSLSALCRDMVSAQIQIVDENLLRRELLAIKNSDALPLAQLGRTIVLEAWLRQLRDHGVLSIAGAGEMDQGVMAVDLGRLSKAH